MSPKQHAPPPPPKHTVQSEPTPRKSGLTWIPAHWASVTSTQKKSPDPRSCERSTQHAPVTCPIVVDAIERQPATAHDAMKWVERIAFPFHSPLSISPASLIVTATRFDFNKKRKIVVSASASDLFCRYRGLVTLESPKSFHRIPSPHPSLREEWGTRRRTGSEAPPCYRYVCMPAPDFVELGHGTREEKNRPTPTLSQ